jgi:hypothetical protein
MTRAALVNAFVTDAASKRCVVFQLLRRALAA